MDNQYKNGQSSFPDPLAGVPEKIAWRIIGQIAMDCVPEVRRRVLVELASRNGHAGSKTRIEMAHIVQVSPRAVERALEDLTFHGMLDREGTGQGATFKWKAAKEARDLWREAYGR